jgi:hypothetical protein
MLYNVQSLGRRGVGGAKHHTANHNHQLHQGGRRGVSDGAAAAAKGSGGAPGHCLTCPQVPGRYRDVLWCPSLRPCNAMMAWAESILGAGNRCRMFVLCELLGFGLVEGHVTRSRCGLGIQWRSCTVARAAVFLYGKVETCPSSCVLVLWHGLAHLSYTGRWICVPRANGHRHGNLKHGLPCQKAARPAVEFREGEPTARLHRRAPERDPRKVKDQPVVDREGAAAMLLQVRHIRPRLSTHVRLCE